ncbi:NAD(P)-dependent oxidoreductase [Mesorhizobium sp. BAC0120]|uniref:NAD(P)-dependent oxidoreductase n=1 Tax=Mesorhizobium sp. BAC0120 TaxID=3090670 RepID=UPI00298CFA7C|nr:NAD(P)-dependent oxidoreductase [Mesorhizobium sp. BAC0120]MDW6021623.1 NAD(P)-dependent oxidoreductase [Mesorhizobium sp. BAC0120]
MTEHLTKIGFIGLGSMGLALALRLEQSGKFRVVGYDRDQDRMKRLAATEGRFELASSIDIAANDSRCVMTCLPSAEAVHEVYCGPGGLADRLIPGQTTIDFSTVPPELAVETGKRVAAAGGAHFEMPVVGSIRDAAEGKLHMLLSATDVAQKDDLPDLIAEVVSLLASAFTIAGPPGAASRFKIIQNGLGLVQLNAIAEAIGICEASGLSSKAFVDFVSAAPGMANTPLFRNTAPLMIAPAGEELTARLAIAAKDSHLYNIIAKQSGARSNFSSLSSALFAEAEASGLSNADFTQVCRLFSVGRH